MLKKFILVYSLSGLVACESKVKVADTLRQMHRSPNKPVSAGKKDSSLVMDTTYKAIKSTNE